MSEAVSGERRADGARRRPVNVTLPVDLLEIAKSLKINVSKSCEAGLAASVAERRAAAWLAENQGAIEAWNQYVEEHGVPLAEFRQF